MRAEEQPLVTESYAARIGFGVGNRPPPQGPHGGFPDEVPAREHHLPQQDHPVQRRKLNPWCEQLGHAEAQEAYPGGNRPPGQLRTPHYQGPCPPPSPEQGHAMAHPPLSHAPPQPYRRPSGAATFMDASVKLISVAQLDCYSQRWKLVARVTRKHSIRLFQYKHKEGTGKLFSVELVDREGGETRATFFWGGRGLLLRADRGEAGL